MTKIEMLSVDVYHLGSEVDRYLQKYKYGEGAENTSFCITHHVNLEGLLCSPWVPKITFYYREFPYGWDPTPAYENVAIFKRLWIKAQSPSMSAGEDREKFVARKLLYYVSLYRGALNNYAASVDDCHPARKGIVD